MRSLTFLALIFTMFQCPGVLGQTPKATTNVASYSVIPFQLTEANNLSVPGLLNQKDTVRLMFHTAADALALTEDAVKQLKSLVFSRVDSVKSWGGSGNTSRFSQHNSLQLGDLTWNDLPIWEDKFSGPKTDGKFGPNLFEHKAIELDFDKGLITLHNLLPEKIKSYEKLRLIAENGFMFLEAQCNTGKTVVKNRFLLHSGYSGALLLDDQFVSQNNIDKELPIIAEKSLKDAFGNVIKTQKAILPALKIGNEILANVPVSFFAGAIGRQKMSILGGDLLKRFNLIIDAQRDYIYLKPNNLTHTPYSNS